MWQRVGYFWRAVAQGGCLMLFFVGGLLLATCYFLPLQWLARDPRRSVLKARHSLGFWFRVYLGIIRVLGLGRVQVLGAERLMAHHGLVVSNHPTLLDYVILLTLKPDVGCLVKSKLWDHRCLGPMVRALGYLRNDEDPETFIATCVDGLQDRASLLIFPEGTRSPAAGLRPFQRGAAVVAVAAGCPVLPVTLWCDPPTLMKGQRWYQVPPRPWTLTMHVGEPVDLAAVIGTCASRAIAARRLTAWLQHHAEEQLRQCRALKPN